MQINITDPTFQTQIFTVILLVLIFISLKKETNPHSMDISNTNELKGLAILMVIFSHIGYFLDATDKFLYPLSVAGGVGVNIFLFLSGFGLTMSALKSTDSPLAFYNAFKKTTPLGVEELKSLKMTHPALRYAFQRTTALAVSIYKKRLKNIFLPMWLVLICFLTLDLILLNQHYQTNVVIKSFLGFFPNADIYTSINSPLWYFTLILFYYLVFPIFFFRKFPVISAISIFVVSYLILHFNLLINFVDKDVLKLYRLHYLAFPIGICFALLQNSKFSLTSLIKQINPFLKYLLIPILMLSVSYTAINSGVGESVRYEQSISLVTMISFLFIILLKNWQSRFLILLGVYSYEIYLIQWPILYRYDFLYKYLPPYMATVLYLVLFLVVGYLIKKLTKKI